MKLNVRAEGDVFVMDVIGEMTLYEIGAFRDKINELSKDKKTLILNLSEVDYIDSTGLGVMISGRNSLDKAGGKLILASPNESVRKVLELTRLTQLFAIYESEEEAIAAN